MSNTRTKSKSGMTAKEKRRAQAIAARRAQLQWYALGAVLLIAVIVAVVILTIYDGGTATQT
jgi:uncharacterized integral membrane protein